MRPPASAWSTALIAVTSQLPLVSCLTPLPALEIGIQVPLGGRGLAGSVVDAAAGLGFVHRIDRGDFPVALGELLDALAVVGIEEDVAEAAIALAGPQEPLAILEELDVTIEIDPVRVGLLKHARGFARFGID